MLTLKLINCPACGKEISPQAISCPHCGQPLMPNTASNGQVQNVNAVFVANQNTGVILTVISFISLAVSFMIPLCVLATIIAGWQGGKRGCKAGWWGMAGGICAAVFWGVVFLLIVIAGTNQD